VPIQFQEDVLVPILTQFRYTVLVVQVYVATILYIFQSFKSLFTTHSLSTFILDLHQDTWIVQPLLKYPITKADLVAFSTSLNNSENVLYQGLDVTFIHKEAVHQEPPFHHRLLGKPILLALQLNEAACQNIQST